MTTAQDRGWGPGWPDCQPDKIATVDAAGVRWRVREEIAELAAAFVTAWHDTVEPLDPAQCWSFVCRAIRGSTTTPSNHSWGLAGDNNSALHPLGKRGTFTAAQVRAIRVLLALPWFRNFRWGGDFVNRADEMHWEYVGTLTDAADDTRLLRAHLEDDDMPITDADLAKIKAVVNGATDAQLKQTEVILQGYVRDLRARIDAIGAGGVDLDALADKVADRLATRLAD